MDVELNLNANSYQRDLAITISNTEKGAKRLETANRELGDSFSDADNKAKRFIDRERSLTSNSKKLADSFSAVAGALAAWKGFSYLQGMSVELDAIGKASRNLDITAEQLQALRYAAKSANFDAGKLESVFARIQNVVGGAKNGDDAEVKKLRAIGLEIDDLKGKNPYEIFEQIANSVMSIADPAERTRAGIAIFGKEFAKMSEFLRTYSSSVEAAKASGMIISDEAVAAAERYQQALTDIDTTIKAMIANSQGLKNISGWLAEIQAYTQNDSAANAAGMKTRAQAVEESITAAEKSGRYTPEQIEKMRAVSGSYAKRTSEFWIGRRYKGAFADIDKALTEAGYGDIARVNGKHSGGDYVMKRRSPSEVRQMYEQAAQKKREMETRESDRELTRALAEADAESGGTGAGKGTGAGSSADREMEKIDALNRKMAAEEKYLDLILAGKKEEAELQKRINELKSDGVLSDQSAEKLARRQLELDEKRKEIAAKDRKMSALEYLQKQTSGLEKKDRKTSEIERMTSEVSKIIGGDVPSEMAKQIEKIAELKSAEDPQKFSEIPTSTNSLIERGGMRLNRLPDAGAMTARLGQAQDKSNSIAALKADLAKMVEKQMETVSNLAQIVSIFQS